MNSPALAPGGSPNLRPGDHLRRIRTRLGITTRQVEELSRKIAAEHDNDEYLISHARIIQVENGESTPSIYKLFTLSAIYGVKITDILALYVDLEKLARHQMELPQDNTRLVDFEVYQPGRTVTFPLRFDPGFNLAKTDLLSRMVEVWGEIPLAMVQHLNVRKMRYGFIGLEDFTLYPLLRPGSLVQIDDRRRKVQN